MNTMGNLDSVCHQKVFFVNLFWCMFKVHQKVDLLVYSSQGSRDSPVYSLGTRELRLPSVFTTGELRLPGVFITSEPGLSGVFMIGKSLRAPWSCFYQF
jgi:hypothetical protein